MQQEREGKWQKEREISLLLHCAPRQDRDDQSRDWNFWPRSFDGENMQVIKSLDALDTPSSQQTLFMKLFMDVIGFELCPKPLGSVLSESGAIVQLVQGMEVAICLH